MMCLGSKFSENQVTNFLGGLVLNLLWAVRETGGPVPKAHRAFMGP